MSLRLCLLAVMSKIYLFSLLWCLLKWRYEQHYLRHFMSLFLLEFTESAIWYSIETFSITRVKCLLAVMSKIYLFSLLWCVTLKNTKTKQPQSLPRFPKVRQGSARFDNVRQGWAMFGKVRQSLVKFGKVRQSSARFGKVRQGLIRFSKVR